MSQFESNGFVHQRGAVKKPNPPGSVLYDGKKFSLTSDLRRPRRHLRVVRTDTYVGSVANVIDFVTKCGGDHDSNHRWR